MRLETRKYRYRRLDPAELVPSEHATRHWLADVPWQVEYRGESDPHWCRWANFATEDEARTVAEKANGAPCDPLNLFGPAYQLQAGWYRLECRTHYADRSTIDDARYILNGRAVPVFAEHSDNASDLIHSPNQQNLGYYADDMQNETYAGAVLSFADPGGEVAPCEDCDCTGIGPDVAAECAETCEDAQPTLYAGYVKSSDSDCLWICADSHSDAREAAHDADTLAERLAEHERAYREVTGYAMSASEDLKQARQHASAFVAAARRIRALWRDRGRHRVEILLTVRKARMARKRWAETRESAFDTIREHGPATLSAHYSGDWHVAFAEG